LETSLSSQSVALVQTTKRENIQEKMQQKTQLETTK